MARTREKIKLLFRRAFRALLKRSDRLLGQVSQSAGIRPAIVEEAAAQIRSDPSFPARFWPRFPGKPAFVVPPKATPVGIDPLDGLPIPPEELWAGYGSSAEAYVQSGREHFEGVRQVLARAGFILEKGSRVLDFGCAAGRMTRCLHSASAGLEVWGVDQSAEHVSWCQSYLSPPLKFLTSTTFPHLPFEDHFFDFIFACSVFTHIGDLEDAWLMELRRITRPGGLLYITVHDNHTIQLILTSPPGHWLHGTRLQQELQAFEAQSRFLENGFRMFFTSRQAGNSQVYHDLEYIREVWGQYLQIVSVTPEAYGYQTAVLLQK
jgi:SAM-dependent methyltransferase